MYEFPYLTRNVLNCITAFLLQGQFWHCITLEGLYAIKLRNQTKSSSSSRFHLFFFLILSFCCFCFFLFFVISNFLSFFYQFQFHHFFTLKSTASTSTIIIIIIIIIISIVLPYPSAFNHLPYVGHCYFFPSLFGIFRITSFCFQFFRSNHWLSLITLFCLPQRKVNQIW